MKAEDEIRNICAQLGERFPEYLIVVKTEPGKIAFRFSEVTWAMGAVERVTSFLQSADDVISAEDDRNEG